MKNAWFYILYLVFWLGVLLLIVDWMNFKLWGKL